MTRVKLGFMVCALAFPALVLLAGGGAIATFIAPVTVGATVLAGGPIYVWCRKRRRFDLGPYLVGGQLAGVLCAIPTAVIAGGWQGVFFFGAWFLVFGAIHGLLFWLVAIFRNDALRATPLPPVE